MVNILNRILPFLDFHNRRQKYHLDILPMNYLTEYSKYINNVGLDHLK